LKEQRRKKGLLIAAHRGTYGGDIMFNTIAAYENALRHKADIIELDAAMTTDGVFYCFHDGKEILVLGTDRNIRTMTSSYVDEQYMRNPSLGITSERVNRLEDALEYLRGRCLINVDRAWFYWKEIISLIKRMGMEEQVILKSPPKAKDLALLEAMAPDMGYMPILNNREGAELTARYKINYCMAELVFRELPSPLVENAFLCELKSRGILIWGNAVNLNESNILAGGKDDRNSITGNPDDNWGWFIDKGFDVLQTDWPLLLRDYLLKRGSFNMESS
jgi:glycerophosphoryl diester phosphodiesterase